MFKAQKGSKDIIKIVHQWFNINFMKLWEYFLSAKKTKITPKNNPKLLNKLVIFAFFALKKIHKITVEPLMSHGLF